MLSKFFNDICDLPEFNILPKKDWREDISECKSLYDLDNAQILVWIRHTAIDYLKLVIQDQKQYNAGGQAEITTDHDTVLDSQTRVIISLQEAIELQLSEEVVQKEPAYVYQKA
jgi:hypothetical protein